MSDSEKDSSLSPNSLAALVKAMRESGAIPPASEPTKPRRKLPEDEPTYRWLQVPPICCDHYTAQYFSGSGVRIAFGEYIGKDYFPIYRSAIVMPLSDTKALIRTLTRIVKEAEAEEEEASKPPAEG